MCVCVLGGMGDHVFVCSEEWAIMCLCARRSGRSCACVVFLLFIMTLKHLNYLVFQSSDVECI